MLRRNIACMIPRQTKAAGGRRRRWLAWLLVLFALLQGLLVWLEQSVRPVILSNALYECERYANEAFQAALARQEAEDPALYDSLYKLVQGSDGTICAVLLDSGRVNHLEADLMGRLHAELAAPANQTLSLPLSVLLGGQLWVGPRVELQFSPDAFVSVDIFDTLEAAGINQTRLCIKARFTVQMSAILAGYGLNADVGQEVLLAELLLAGDVPQGYWGSMLS